MDFYACSCSQVRGTVHLLPMDPGRTIAAHICDFADRINAHVLVIGADGVDAYVYTPSYSLPPRIGSLTRVGGCMRPRVLAADAVPPPHTLSSRSMLVDDC